MSGALSHTPAQIIRQLLIDLSLATLPTDSGSWPAYHSRLPDTPSDAMVVTDTEPILEGRVQPTGETQQHYGIQIRIRADDSPDGEAKARAITRAFDVDVRRNSVTIDSTTYLVHSTSLRSGPLPLGPEGETKRRQWSLNYITAIRST